jgi:ribosomal protein S18 acetylase RimI-like enzyme
MTFSIRPFCSGDEPAVIALWHAAGLTRAWNDPERDIERKLRVQAEWFLVAELNGELIGSVMAGYDGRRGWLNYLAIAPGMRRRGYARALVESAETQLRAAGCPKLNLQVRAENPAAIAFYERLGYRQDAVVSLGKRLIPDA